MSAAGQIEGEIMNGVHAALALAIAGILVPVQSSATGKPVLIYMQAALDIDGDGRVAAVTYIDERKVPDFIRQRGEQVAKAWMFQPPVKNGRSVTGRTFVGMQVCLVPRDDSLDIAITSSDNGPATILSARSKPVRTRAGGSAALPLIKLLDQDVSHWQGKVVYTVSAEGKSKLESATLDDPQLQERYGDLWLKAQDEIFKGFRYLPELTDGVPTSTRMESTVEFWADRADRAARTQERDEQSDACQALKSDNGRQIASDSPFKRIEG